MKLFVEIKWTKNNVGLLQLLVPRSASVVLEESDATNKETNIKSKASPVLTLYQSCDIADRQSLRVS